jgi:hypothetical protein
MILKSDARKFQRLEGRWLNGEVRWLNGHAPDCCPWVPGSNLVSPQPTADCQSPGGLTPGIALGCRLTSVRGNRGENCENELLVCQKKKNSEIYRVVKKILRRISKRET